MVGTRVVGLIRGVLLAGLSRVIRILMPPITRELASAAGCLGCVVMVSSHAAVVDLLR